MPYRENKLELNQMFHFSCYAQSVISAQRIEHVFSHHIGAAGGALGSWHELGLALPPNAVAPQSLADVLRRRKRAAKGKLVGRY